MQRRFGAASITVTVKGWHISSLKGDPGCSLWPQAVLREIVSIRVGLVVRQSLTQSVGYRGFAGSLSSCLQSRGPINSLLRGRAGTPVGWVEVQRQHQSLHSGLRTGTIQENIRTSSCRWDRNSTVTLAR